MRSQVLLAEAIVIFIIVVTVLLLAAPLHQDISPYVEAVKERDAQQVSRLT